MAQKVELELVTPKALLRSLEADMVVVPGGEGDIGVLRHHAPMLSTLRPGVVDIHDNNEVSDRVFVAGGFAEVTEDRCTILAEEAVPMAELSQARAEQEMDAARKAAQEAEGDYAMRKAEQRMAVAEAMQAAVQEK